MAAGATLDVVTSGDLDALLRVLNLLAQRDILPVEMHVAHRDDALAIRLRLGPVEPAVLALVSEKIRALVPVASVALRRDG
jgi:hypothetical protein